MQELKQDSEEVKGKECIEEPSKPVQSILPSNIEPER